MNSPDSRPTAPVPELSVVIPAYNEAATIARTLDSVARAQVLAERAGIRSELLVVCNACTDRTPEVVQAHGARVILEPAKGIAKARQAGQMGSQGEIIVCTDADTEVPPEWLMAHARHYSDPQVVGVGGPVQFDSVHWLYTLGQQCWREIRYNTVRIQRGILQVQPNYTALFLGANMSYRRQVAQALGGFDPGINHGEDLALADKLRTRGTLQVDTSTACTVRTSGRRFDTAQKVLRHYWQRAWPVLKSNLLGTRATSEHHEDVRD